jgi:hypothetical protein
MLGKVMEEVSVSASGPELLVTIMMIIYSGAGYDTLEKCKTRQKFSTMLTKGFFGFLMLR